MQLPNAVDKNIPTLSFAFAPTVSSGGRAYNVLFILSCYTLPKLEFLVLSVGCAIASVFFSKVYFLIGTVLQDELIIVNKDVGISVNILGSWIL